MLQFVLGRAGSGKTETLRRRLAALSGAGKKKLFLLVPEQYSFEAEKAMLTLCGPRRAGDVAVYSFTRLAEAVFRKEGGAAGRRLSDGGRRILMSMALDACGDRLEVYKNAAKSGRITDVMLTAVNEMKMCGIAPGQLTDTAEKLPAGGLKKKLGEIGLLYGAYEALVAVSYLDSRDDLTRLAEALKTSDFFAGATVMVDSFDGFTAQETAVLTQILRRAETVTVALCTDGLEQGPAGLFALVERTRGRLIRAAREQGVPLGETVLLTGAPRFANENLKLLEAQLFCADEPMTAETHEGIEIFEARDVFQEAEFAAATIRRLVQEKGWRYRDFAIICRSPEHYYGNLDVALAKRDIPCFVSQPDRVDAEPVPRFVLGAFEAVQSGMGTDALLEMLKTGVSGFTDEEISDLENYAFLWRLGGPDWRAEFTRHPRGFGQEETEEDRLYLDYLNGLRRRLMEPLLRFAAATRDASGGEISQAVFDLLMAFGLEETLPAYCRTLEAAGEESLAAKQLRIWDLMMGLLDQLYSILGDRKIPRERYYRLLREVTAAEDVSEIPQTVDEVIFGTVEQVRQTAPKAVFLLGVTQGDFPLTPRPSGVFSDVERRELIAMDLPLGDPMEQRSIEERYLAYSVASIPSELLYLSWPAAVGGEEKSPSELIAAVREVFPALVPLKDLPDEYYANSREAAFSRMAARMGERTAAAASFRALFAEEPDYAGRLRALERAAGRGGMHIRDRALAGKLYGENPFLSPTQIETYHACPFKYFCRYGLNARERRPAEVDVLEYGTMMHYLFEKIFRIPAASRAALSEEALLEQVQGLILRYADESMGGFTLLSGREKYRLDRLARSACVLIRHVDRELAQSRFTPKYFELGLSRDGAYPPLKIETGDGGSVTVGGTIDRADTVVLEDGREYIRVVDYKTGRKEFRLSDVLYGLNMQMLVYLAALVENGQSFPAGILYMPAAEPSVTADRDEDEAQIQKDAEKQLRMSGLVLNDREIIQAMEDGAKGRFIPASLKKDGSVGKSGSVLDEDALRLVLEHCKRLIATMGRALRQGAAEAEPCMMGQNACRYCPYQPVCGKEYGERDKTKVSMTNGEVLRCMAEGKEETHG